MVVTMKLKRLGENKLEIILSAAELAAWELCPQQIKQPDPLTQSILARLLHKASQQSGFPVEEGEFAIEISQDEDQTIFHLTRIVQDQGQLQVFRFGTSEEMLGGCLRLYERMGNKAGENKLYWMDDSYYLTVLLPEEEVAAAKEILLEYGSCALHPDGAAAVLSEHGSCLMKKDALQKLDHHFSKD